MTCSLKGCPGEYEKKQILHTVCYHGRASIKFPQTKKGKYEMLNLDHYTEAITEICVRLEVKRLEVFGSSLRDDFDSATSDIDFFYEFESTEDIFKRFMILKRELESLFGRRVDLLKENQIQNPFIKEQIAKATRKTLYAA